MTTAKKTRPRDEKDLWYKDAIIYEIHVRAFNDSDGDGVGDFRGLTERLDYLRDLGVTAIWILPFCPSPWRDDGYDISDYTDVHPSYGTLRDFQSFMKAAKKLGLRVITELVINHTSDQHPWFQKSRRAKPGSRWRDFYVWSDSPDRYADTRIIFKDFESSNWSWDPVANAYYWHRFYSHQPDLNFDSPQVRKAVLAQLDFWFEMGVDGLRLDAIPYLFEREGTNCENLPETHGFLKEARRHIDAKFPDKMLLAEANQWPEDAVAYFGDGDECHMSFHFPVMPRLFMAIRREDRFPIIDILDLTPPIPDNCQWAMFLRNHDELTLEMVTDEERDYMYRVYANDPRMRINLGIRRRLAPLLENHRRRIELMNALLFSLPGTPVIYYGDEIGMGDNIYIGDRNGVRTPMQWNADRNAGFSKANPQRLYLPVNIDPEYHYESINVETQHGNSNSLLWWMKHLIGLRKQSLAFSRGTIEFLHPDNPSVLVFLRRYQEETILAVFNLSRFPQPVELDLSEFDSAVPTEVFGGIQFPPIGKLPYFLTLGPHAFYWFRLDQATELPAVEPARTELPLIAVSSQENLYQREGKQALARLLPAHLKRSRWFRAKARSIRSVEVEDSIPFVQLAVTILILKASYSEGDPERYLLPLAVATGGQSREIQSNHPQGMVARFTLDDGQEALLYEAIYNQQFCKGLLEGMERRRRFKGEVGELQLMPSKVFRELRGEQGIVLEPSVQKAEQSNSSIIYGDRLILKLFRQLEEGTNPDLEIGRFLTEKTGFQHTPQVAGSIEYRRKTKEAMTVAILQGFAPNQGDAWSHTVGSLGRYFERVLTQSASSLAAPESAGHPMDLVDQEISAEDELLSQNYLEDARLLGQRTAEMHLALATKTENPDFVAEPFTDFYRQGLYHGIIGLINSTFRVLRKKLKETPKELQEDVHKVLDLQAKIQARVKAMQQMKITALRLRHHGDYHLGQVLYTGKDFIIIDFEGEPARPLSQRRMKRSPLRDIAGMLRSFHYASCSVLFDQVPGVIARPELQPTLRAWGRYWYQRVSALFLQGYLQQADQASYLPRTREEFKILLDAFLLEKAVYEVGYELNNRPAWLGIPLRGILDLLSEATGTRHGKKAGTGPAKTG